jgi:hypothetical protein
MATQGLPPIRKQLLEEILRQLGIAQNTITDLLSNATSADATRRLQRQRAEIARAMHTFDQAAAQAMENAADDVWAAGIENAVESIGHLGLAPRIAQGPLNAIRSFLTSRIADISRAAVGKINTALTQQILGVQSMADTITQIERILDGAPRARAMTVAYTEIGRAYSLSQWETGLQKLKLLPGLQKSWIHSGKLHPRPGHVLASKQPPIPFLTDFQIVDLRTGETENMRFPRDPNASAFNTINCGCMMVLHAPPASDIFSQPLTHVVKGDGSIVPIGS